MKRPTIFFPHYLDLWNPIQTIHREVSLRLVDTYDIMGFQRDPDETIDGVKLLTVRPSDPIYNKGFQYLREYSKRFDVVHTGPGRRHYLARISQYRGSNVVHTLHATPEDKQMKDRQKRLGQQANTVTAVSPYVKTWAEDELGLSNVRIIPNGVDTGIFTPGRVDTQDKTILFVSRFAERKHPEFVLKIAKTLPDFTIKIRGGDPAELQDTIPNNVEFVPHLSRNGLADLFSSATCLVCPFEREGFGMVVLEALASGTPVVAFDDGNLPNLVGDENGEVCESLDVAEWGQAIRNVCNSDPNQVRQSAVAYSWDAVASEYDSLYQELL